MQKNYITDEVKAVIGASTEWVEAPHAVESSEVRRFFQATIDPNPRFHDDKAAAKLRAGGVVAPPAFPVHAFRRPSTEFKDPLDSMGDPDFDGVSRSFRPGLPSVKIPLGGVLNGGYSYQFFSYVKVGEKILCKSSYKDVYQREGKTGPLIFILVEDDYKTEDGRPLLRSVNTMIMR